MVDMDIEKQIEERIGEVRTDTLDLSIGEIVNLHENKELIIQPEYQRLFRWSRAQRSRLVESVVLELPIPQIFLIENTDSVLELIDGLQRVSSLIQFINSSAIALDPLVLEDCDVIHALNGQSFSDLPLSLRLRLKRSTLRCILIRKQSKSFLRYEMFKRLNTGGSILASQEIRNCSARMLGESGTAFYVFLQKLAGNKNFQNCIEPLSQSDLDQKADEELVLRFFAAKNSESSFRGSVRDWLDSYMEKVLLGNISFDFAIEEHEFVRLFDYLARVIGRGAFVRYRDDEPIGALAPAYFEAVTMGIYRVLPNIQLKPDNEIAAAIVATVQTENFKNATGPGANSKEKLASRIGLISNATLAV